MKDLDSSVEHGVQILNMDKNEMLIRVIPDHDSNDSQRARQNMISLYCFEHEHWHPCKCSDVSRYHIRNSLL